MARRADDPNAQLLVELYAVVFAHALQQSGRQAAALASAVGCNPSYVYAIPKAERLPSLEMTRAFDREMAAGGLLVDVRRLIERLELAARRARTLEGDPPEESDLERRTLLGLLGSLAVTGKVAEQLEDSRRMLDAAFVAEPTGRDADEWARVAQDYAHDVGRLPASQLLPELLTDTTEIQARIDEASGTVKKRLLHVAGQLAALTAITLISAGDARSARRWWRTAARAADDCGDHRLAAHIRGRQAVFSLYSARTPLIVIDMADEAIETAAGAPCAGVMSGLGARAQALARLGRHKEAVDATNTLAGVFEQLPDFTRRDTTTQWGWSEQRLRHVETFVYSEAGDIERAEQAHAAAVALYPADSCLGPAQVELYRARCYIRAGDVSAGAEHTARTLEALAVHHRTDGLVVQTAVATLSLIPPEHAKMPAVRNARELLAIRAGDR